MNYRKYPDGTGYWTVVKEDRGGEFTFKVNNYADLWRMYQFIDAYTSVFAEEPVITIPCLLDAQADRRFEVGQTAGLKVLLQSLDSQQAFFNVFHPHNPEMVEGMVGDVRIMSNQYFVQQVIKDIDGTYANTKLNPENNLILMSADAGGFKPLIKLADSIDWKGETYSASKARVPGGKMVQQIDREDFGGKDILIVDDISVYGGTFKGLSKLLRERNCGKLYLAVSHMTVQTLGEDPVTEYFDRLFTTNSKFEEYYLYEDSNGGGHMYGAVDNLEVINMFKYDG
tara:strand:+ start:10306 stop:11157 length:852 start_codon:yes stop_codon:yes gene_type:complete